MNKRKILLVAVALCMVAILGFGGTLAYLTDTDNATNVFTVGNVKIEQYEKDRNGADYVDNQHIFPIVDDGKDENGYHTGANYIDKIVTVKNTGTENAYVRTYIAIPAELDDGPTTFDASANILHWNGASANDSFGLANLGNDNDWYWTPSLSKDWPTTGDWNGYVMTLGGVTYNVYVATHDSFLIPGETTAPCLYGVYLDKKVDCDDVGYCYYENGVRKAINFDLSQPFNVLVMTEAVQAEGFDNAIHALDSAFEAVGTHCPFGGTIIETY